ncbi:MAG TPA: YggT family protein [Candidatus Tumulicola sp.]|jgi:YggT family protein
MNSALCSLSIVLNNVLTAYIVLLFIYAVVSWFPNARGRWVDILASLVEPVLRPVRRIIPPIGGIDIAFLVVFLLLQVVVRHLIGIAIVDSCVPY